VSDRAADRLCCISGSFEVFPSRSEQEHRVVHRDGEHEGEEEEQRCLRGEVALALEAHRPGRPAVLEGQRTAPKAAATDNRLKTTPTAATSSAWNSAASTVRDSLWITITADCEDNPRTGHRRCLWPQANRCRSPPTLLPRRRVRRGAKIPRLIARTPQVIRTTRRDRCENRPSRTRGDCFGCMYYALTEW
jgi:hypothetical protein